MAAAGFPDREFPNGRVLRLCAGSDQMTASQIGRELGITRQGAGKIVSTLVERDYLALAASSTDRREKVVVLTPRAFDYLAAQRMAVQRIEQELQSVLGGEAFDALSTLLDALGTGDNQPRLRDYLRYATRLDDEAASTGR